MAKTFQIGIYSSNKAIYEGEVISMIVPSESGYLGVLADHAPLAAKIKPGIITLKDMAGKTTSISVEAQGYLEVLRNKTTALLG